MPMVPVSLLADVNKDVPVPDWRFKVVPLGVLTHC